MIFKKTQDSFLSFSIFGYLLMIVLFPQYIKYESLIIVLIMLLTCIFKKISLKMDNISCLWAGYILIGFFSSIISRHIIFNNTIEALVSLIMSFIISVMIVSEEACKSRIKYIYILVTVVLSGACLQVIAPDFIFNFNKMHLNSEKFEMFYNFFRSGVLVGFSYQTAIVAFYCSIFIGINVSYFFCYKSENTLIKNIFLLMFSVLALIVIFFTSKRSFILYSVFLVLLLCCFFCRKHIFKLIFYGTFLAIGLYELLINTKAGQRMIERSQGDSITTGRDILAKRMIGFFCESPIFGNGLASTLSLITDYTNGHNIYIQILSETGILGFVLLISFFVINIKVAFKELINNVNDNQRCFIFSSCFCIEIIFLLWGFTGNPLYDVYPLFVYMSSIGVVWSMKSNS